MLLEPLAPGWLESPHGADGACDRRNLLKHLAMSAAAIPLVMPLDAIGAVSPSSTAAKSPGYAGAIWSRPRWVWLRRSTTGEQIRVVYWANGKLIDAAYRQISWFMRDLRFERMLANRDPLITQALQDGRIGRQHLSPWMLMEPILLDVLYAHCAWLDYFGIQQPLVLTSGLRHILTNALTEGAAFDSLHTKGGAGDIVVPGVSPERVAAFSRWLQAGGVGLYVNKGFTHVDRGRVRTWVA